MAKIIKYEDNLPAKTRFPGKPGSGIGRDHFCETLDLFFEEMYYIDFLQIDSYERRSRENERPVPKKQFLALENTFKKNVCGNY